MQRLYCCAQNISGDKIIIDDKAQVHHIRNVLRVKAGEEIIVFDGRGSEYKALIEEFLPGKVRVKVEAKVKPEVSQGIALTVACALPKGSRMDDIIDKLTQLGVERIIPLETERVIVKLNKQKRILREGRWKKIALNAGLQSQRNILPVIEPIKNIEQLLADAAGFDLKLIPTLSERKKSLKEALGAIRAKNVLILIGPEGDFTEKEVRLAKNSGFIPVSLGDSVLRVDTAAVAVASFIRLYGNG